MLTKSGLSQKQAADFSQSTVLLAQWGQISPESGADRKTLSLGYVHALSKRTELYAVGMNDKVEGLSSGSGYSLGIRHRF